MLLAGRLLLSSCVGCDPVIGIQYKTRQLLFYLTSLVLIIL